MIRYSPNKIKVFNTIFNFKDKPLYSDWNSNSVNNLILDILNSSHIKKSIFVYNLKKEFICKFEGVTQCQKI